MKLHQIKTVASLNQRELNALREAFQESTGDQPAGRTTSWRAFLNLLFTDAIRRFVYEAEDEPNDYDDSIQEEEPEDSDEDEGEDVDEKEESDEDRS